MEHFQVLLFQVDEATRGLIESLLSLSGHAVATNVIATERGLITELSSKWYGLVIIGALHKEVSAQKTIEVLRDRKLKTPVFVLYGEATPQTIVEYMKLGVADCLSINNLERLPIAMNNVMEQTNLKQEQERFFDELVARKTLMKNAERLAHFGTWRDDRANGKLYWSDEKYRILGFQPGEIIPTWDHFYERVHEEDKDFVKNTLSDAIRARTRQKFTFRIVGSKGEVKYIHCEVFIVRDSNLEIVEVHGFLRDISEHTQAEIKLVESEEKYLNLFESNPSALSVIDLESGRFMDVNKAVIDQYGYTRDEFLSQTIYDVLHKSELMRFIDSDIFQSSGLKNNGIWKTVRKGGSVIHVELISSEIIFEGRKCRFIISNDISSKLATITRLKESEARLIASQRIGHIGSWEIELNDTNPSMHVVKWTDETYRIFGFLPNSVKLTGAFFRSLIHPDDHVIIDDAIRKTTLADNVFTIEFRIFWPDGSERIVREIGEVTFDEDTGRPVRISGTAQDITERKQAAQKLEKSEANMRSLFDNTDTAYVLLDNLLNVVSFNAHANKFSKMYMKRPMEEGAFILNYFQELRQLVFRKTLKEALKGENRHYEVDFNDDGIEKWYLVHIHPVYGEGEKILGIILSVRDITDTKMADIQEKKITAELIKRNKDLEQFAYIISHNLRAPVANLLGIAEALTEQNLSEEEKVIFAEGLHTSTRKLDMVITDLNRILQMRHEVNTTKEMVHFSDIVHDITESLSGVKSTGEFQISVDFSQVDEMITLKSYMHSIFYNMISNAIKYKKPNTVPHIEIKSRKLPHHIELTFRDHGLGIDLERNGELLFRLYKRFHMNAAEGKGMGLYMVKTQVETLDGRISVSSKVNEGTEFKIEFATPR